MLPRRRGQVRAGLRAGPDVCVDHHVADQLRALGEALAAEVGHRRRRRGEQQVRQVVGHDPVALLGHAPVEGAQARFDVRQPGPPAIVEGQLRGHDRRGQGRVRIAVDEDAVGPSLAERRLEAAHHLAGHRAVRPAADLQVQGRLVHLQVAKEGRAHRVVVVLAGVDQDLVMTGGRQRAADRRRLHELRSRTDDGRDPHDGNGVPHAGQSPANGSPSTSRSGWPQAQALAEPVRRVAGDELVVGHVARDDAARADHRPAADRHAGQDRAVRAQRGSGTHEDRRDLPVVIGLGRAVPVDGARHAVVREAHMRADEHSVLHGHAAEEADVVLDLHPVADDDARVDVDVLADDAAGADASVLPHLGLVPDAGAGTDDRVGRHLGGRVHAHVRTVDHLLSSGAAHSTRACPECRPGRSDAQPAGARAR